MDLQHIPPAVVLTAALVAAVTDVWKFRVYNALTLPLLASGVLFHALTGVGWGGLTQSVIGMLAGLGVLFMPYWLGGYGGGDVKLMAGLGAWLGPEKVLYVFVASALAGGVYALFLVVRHGQLGETWTRLKVVWYRLAAVGRHLGADDGVAIEAGGRVDRRRVIPFAAMMCVGVVATLLWLWYTGGSAPH